jgi:hypothetical protein
MPDLSATSSRRSGLSPSLVTMSRIMLGVPLRPRPKPRHHPANQRPRRLNKSLGKIGMCNAPSGYYRTRVC